jgi:hypothetical protein
MLGVFAAMIATQASTPPVINRPSFQCTPVWIDTRIGAVGCSEGQILSLWGITLLAPENLKLSAKKYHNALATSFRATGVRQDQHGRLRLINAPTMICHSQQRGGRITAQCFVNGEGVFGDVDLACLLLKAKVASVKRFAKDFYSMCLLGNPKIQRGERADVFKNSS